MEGVTPGDLAGTAGTASGLRWQCRAPPWAEQSAPRRALSGRRRREKGCSQACGSHANLHIHPVIRVYGATLPRWCHRITCFSNKRQSQRTAFSKPSKGRLLASLRTMLDILMFPVSQLLLDRTRQCHCLGYKQKDRTCRIDHSVCEAWWCVLPLCLHYSPISQLLCGGVAWTLVSVKVHH